MYWIDSDSSGRWSLSRNMPSCPLTVSVGGPDCGNLGATLVICPSIMDNRASA